MLERHDAALGAHRGRLVVVDREPHLVRQSLLDRGRQRGLAGPEARLQLGVQSPDALVLEQQLQLLLQGVDVERRARAEREPAPQVALPEPAVALDVDLDHAALDDLIGHRPLGDRLVRQDRSRVDVAAVDVQQGQRDAKRLQVLRGQLPVEVRRGGGGNLLGRQHRVAHDADLTHEDAQRRQDLAFGRRGQRRQDRHGRRTPRLLLLEGRRLPRSPGGIAEGRLRVSERVRKDRDDADGAETGCGHLKQRGAGTHSAIRFDRSSWPPPSSSESPESVGPSATRGLGRAPPGSAGSPSRPDTTRLLDWPPASRVAHAARSSVAACSTDSGSCPTTLLTFVIPAWMPIVPGTPRAEDALRREFEVRKIPAKMLMLPPGPPNASARISLPFRMRNPSGCAAVPRVILPPPPNPLCTLVVILPWERNTCEPVVVIEMLPPSALVAAVVMALSWTRRLLPRTSEIFPALPACALVAETVPWLVKAISAVLIVMLPPAPPAVAFEDTAAPPEMLTKAGAVIATSPP